MGRKPRPRGQENGNQGGATEKSGVAAETATDSQVPNGENLKDMSEDPKVQDVAVEKDTSSALDHMSADHDKEVRPLLDLVDKLRSLGMEKDIAIPQIAVFGDQSSGKSSVLEAISGVPFPRGSGLVTRCATQLTMKRNKSLKAWKGRVFLNWEHEQPDCAGPIEMKEDVAGTIEKLTEHLTKDPAGYSDTSIVIECESADCPDLTLIDLPGIVRTTTAGQSANVISIVDSLLESYLVRDRTIILAVAPGNVDIATVDILERAAKHDPSGERTMQVMTKLDLTPFGQEHDVINVIHNFTKRTKLGFFFRNHQHFSSIDPSLVGVQNLTSKLTLILANNISKALPNIHAEVRQKLSDVRMQVEQYGQAPPESEAEKRYSYVRMVLDFSSDFKKSCVGQSLQVGDGSSVRPVSGNPEGEAADRDLFSKCKDEYKGFSNLSMQGKPTLKAARLQELAKQNMGKTLEYMFPPYHVSLDQFQKSISSWRTHADETVEIVAHMVHECLERLAHAHLSRYKTLLAFVLLSSSKIVETQTQAVLARIKYYSDAEMDPFTLNSDFMLQVRLSRESKKKKRLRRIDEGKLQLDAEVETIGEELECALSAYYNLAAMRYIDNVCMAISADMLTCLSNALPAALLAEQHDGPALDRLFTLSVQETSRLKLLEASLVRLQGAAKALFSSSILQG